MSTLYDVLGVGRVDDARWGIRKLVVPSLGIDVPYMAGGSHSRVYYREGSQHVFTITEYADLYKRALADQLQRPHLPHVTKLADIGAHVLYTMPFYETLRARKHPDAFADFMAMSKCYQRCSRNDEFFTVVIEQPDFPSHLRQAFLTIGTYLHEQDVPVFLPSVKRDHVFLNFEGDIPYNVAVDENGQLILLDVFKAFFHADIDEV